MFFKGGRLLIAFWGYEARLREMRVRGDGEACWAASGRTPIAHSDQYEQDEEPAGLEGA